MKSIYSELALYGRANQCARTDNVFSPISEVCDDTVSLSRPGGSQGLLYKHLCDSLINYLINLVMVCEREKITAPPRLKGSRSAACAAGLVFSSFSS